MKKLLIIPDCHVNYAYSNDRFEALGNFIVDERPNTIINIGDFADMASLCSYDFGTASFEGRRYKKDVESVIDAQEVLFRPINEYNRKHNNSYNPRLELCLGNHENRINIAIESDPKLDGTLSVDDLGYKEYGWHVSPFLVPIVVGGISFSHYFISGVANRPISGEAIGRTMCLKLHASAVQGHSHVFDLAERTVITGQRIFGLSCGCFVHPDYNEEWCVAIQRLWWRGVIMLEDLDGEGYYDHISIITQRKLLRDYL